MTGGTFPLLQLTSAPPNPLAEGFWVELFWTHASPWAPHRWYVGTALGRVGLSSSQTHEIGQSALPMYGAQAWYWCGQRSDLLGPAWLMEAHPKVWHEGLPLDWAELRTSGTHVVMQGIPSKYGTRTLFWAGWSSEPAGPMRIGREHP